MRTASNLCMVAGWLLFGLGVALGAVLAAAPLVVGFILRVMADRADLPPGPRVRVVRHPIGRG
jgi:hypothetical protein